METTLISRYFKFWATFVLLDCHNYKTLRFRLHLKQCNLFCSVEFTQVLEYKLRLKNSFEICQAVWTFNCASEWSHMIFSWGSPPCSVIFRNAVPFMIYCLGTRTTSHNCCWKWLNTRHWCVLGTRIRKMSQEYMVLPFYTYSVLCAITPGFVLRTPWKLINWRTSGTRI